MRRTAAEKTKIIRLIEGSDLPVKMTLRQLGVLLSACSLACGFESAPGPSDPSGLRFVQAGAGIVLDERTGLVWMAHDSGRDLSWWTAQRRCQEIGLQAEGASWRLPTIGELETLFDAIQRQPCAGQTCRTDPAIDLTSPYQWSGTARGGLRRVYFDFANGNALAPRLRANLTRRSLCTRDS